MSDDPLLDAIYIEGTNKLKPGILGIFVTAAIILGLGTLIGLYNLARHIEAHVRWRRYLRRVGCSDTAELNSRISNMPNARESSVIVVGLSPDPLLDTNYNQVRVNYAGSASVQMMYETSNPRINQLEKTQFQTNSDSKLQKLKATPFDVFNNNFSPAGFDPNNNPISRILNPVTFASKTEIREEVELQADENEPEIGKEQEQQQRVVETLDSTKDLPPPSADDDEASHRKWWDVSTRSSFADVDQEDTDHIHTRRMSENTRTTSIAGSLVLMGQGAPGPSAYMIPDSYVREEIPLSDKMKDLPDFLEYSQAEGGWVRKKFENYVPATSHQSTYPKDDNILGLGYGYLARIIEPVNRFVTSLVTPDPSSTTIDVIDRPARFNLTEYTDSDQLLIEAEIQRLTRIRSMGIISFLDLLQAEAFLRTEDSLAQIQTPDTKESVLLSTPGTPVSKSSVDDVEVEVLEENAEPVALVTSVISVKKEISVPAIIEPKIPPPLKIAIKPKKCCCC